MQKNALYNKLTSKFLRAFERNELDIPIIGMLSLFGHPLFYFIWSHTLPQPYENLICRLINVTVGIPFVFYNNLSERFKKIFPVFFFIGITFLLPFFFSFMLHKNEWNTTWFISTLIALAILILLIEDWILILFLSITGYSLAFLTVWLLDGQIRFTYFEWQYVPTFFFLLLVGVITSHRKQTANQTKISMLQSLSGSIAHEMRNPLHSIANAISSLQSILPDKPGKQEHDTYSQNYELSRSGLISLHNIIEESSKTVIRANKIIDSILTNLQGQSVDRNTFRQVNAISTIHDAISDYSYESPDDRNLIKVLGERDFDFFGDKDLFVYVLFNLIKNALYYKEKPGFFIEISTQTGSNGNTIKVHDTGPGIPVSKLERVFDDFYTSGKNDGIGLGLSFCKRVLTSFGGQITCNSKENEWAEFILHFPLYHSKEAEDLKKKVLQGKNILIVNNNSSNRRIVDKYLSEWHCNTRHAQNGTQALSMLVQQRFDLILMNLEMPTVSGDEVVGQIRRKKHNVQFPTTNYKQIPIIGLSNRLESEAKQRYLRSGMNELIPTPLRRKHIHALLEKYFFSETEPLIHNTDTSLDNAGILIVDDNHTSRKFISFVLERMGARVMQAENGEEALEHLEKNDYELIFMDMEMPVLNGINTTRIIREGKRFKRFGKYREIPIIALTGNTDDANITLAKQSGMNDHLGKPFGKEDLTRVLSTWLKK